MWYDGEETEEITSTRGNTHDATVFGPVKLSNRADTLLNIDSILRLLNPSATGIELNTSVGSKSHLAQVLVVSNLLNRTHAWSEGMELLTQGIWVKRNQKALPGGKSDEKLVFGVPNELYDFTVALIEFQIVVLLSLWIEPKDFGTSSRNATKHFEGFISGR